MRELLKLVNLNNPDLVLFVGEALGGNGAVDQLSKFNQQFRTSPLQSLAMRILAMPVDATASGTPTIQYHNIPDQPITTIVVATPVPTFGRWQCHCFGTSIPEEFPLAANPFIVLHVLTACNLDLQDLRQATCSFFRQLANFASDFELSISELAALDMCQKRGIFMPMIAEQRQELKQRCGGFMKIGPKVLVGWIGMFQKGEIKGNSRARSERPPLSFSIISSFFILGLIGLEKLNWWSSSSQPKSVGTVLSIAGAFVVTFYKGLAVLRARLSSAGAGLFKRKEKTHMGRTHGGFKCGEAVVKGAENGDDAVSDGLALSQLLTHHGCSDAQ
ncbi:hypothetical protein ACE6H2_002708 [Prunus campanulata]